MSLNVFSETPFPQQTASQNWFLLSRVGSVCFELLYQLSWDFGLHVDCCRGSIPHALSFERCPGMQGAEWTGLSDFAV